MLQFHSKIPSTQLNFLHRLTEDYINQSEDLTEFYHYTPTLDGAIEAIEKRQFTQEKRNILVDALKRQYNQLKTDASVQANIEALTNQSTFTVTTGHQLALFTGPLYFIYKICGTIKLAKDLSAQLPDHKIVPVFWLASEDHDFEEIQSANIGTKKLTWLKDASGAVGRLKTEEIDAVISQLQEFLGISIHANQLVALFKKAYTSKNTLAEATRIIVNQLFGHFGLIIIDGDDAELKKVFAPTIQKDILEGVSFENIQATNAQLESRGYKIQVNPREINFFYLTENFRERFIPTENGFGVMNSTYVFTADELQKELDQHPERFSPNAVLRPLYQETILPNIAYIGGGAEVAYWLELKSMFDAHKVQFPVLLLRDSAGILPHQTLRKTDELLHLRDVFLDETAYINKLIENQKVQLPDFEKYTIEFQQLFDRLKSDVTQHNVGIEDSVSARFKQTENSIDSIKDKLMREMRKKQLLHKDRFFELKELVFPQGKLQERYLNVSEIYTSHGIGMLDTLVEHFNPFEPCIHFFIEQ